MNVLDAAKEHKVKRVVMLSSIDAMANREEDFEQLDESFWSEENYKHNDAYTKSKLLAEKAAWSFMESLPAEDKFELVTLCPAYIVGPVITGGEDSTPNMIR